MATITVPSEFLKLFNLSMILIFVLPGFEFSDRSVDPASNGTNNLHAIDLHQSWYLFFT